MTRVGLGCARLGSAATGYGWRSSIRLVHAALDAGVTYFDTADAYGSGASELVLGRALRGRRGSVTLASKGGYLFDERSMLECRVWTPVAGALRRVAERLDLRRGERRGDPTSSSAYAEQDFSPEYLTRALERSLRRLGTDHVDVYQLHGPRAAEPAAIAEWAATMVESGRIGRLGVGAESVEQAARWLGCGAVRSLQVPFGLLDPAAGTEVIPAAHASGREVVVRGVLGAGLLVDPSIAGSDNAHKLPLIEGLRAVASDAGVDVAELAVSFAARRPDVDIIVVGTASADHLQQIAATAAQPLADDTLWAAVEAAMERYRWA